MLKCAERSLPPPELSLPHLRLLHKVACSSASAPISPHLHTSSSEKNTAIPHASVPYFFQPARVTPSHWPLASISYLLAPMPPKHKEPQKQKEPVTQTLSQQPQSPSAKPQSPSAKRPLPQNSTASPAKRQSKWSPEEDALIIKLRGRGLKWEDISKQLPGRSAISCRLHYQNYLERRSEWDEERKDRLARLYERFKQEMWSQIAKELNIPWKAAESMHWQIGEQEMARRAGVVPFSQSSVALDAPPKKRSPPRRSPSPGGLGEGSSSGPSALPAEAGPVLEKEDASK